MAPGLEQAVMTALTMSKSASNTSFLRRYLKWVILPFLV